MSRDERIGIGPVLAGTAVSLAVTSALLLLGGGLAAAHAGSLDMSIFSDEALAAGAWIAGSAAVGAFLGGRTAAMASRALVRRDGALAGFITGSVVALFGLAGGWGIAALWPASHAAELLMGVAAFELVTLLLGIVGGTSGARSEAKAIGLRAVRHGFHSGDSLERDFFGGASLSSSTTSLGNQGIP